MMVNNIFCLVVEPYPSEKYELVKVSWDDEFPIYGKIKHVLNHQPATVAL